MADWAPWGLNINITSAMIRVFTALILYPRQGLSLMPATRAVNGKTLFVLGLSLLSFISVWGQLEEVPLRRNLSMPGAQMHFQRSTTVKTLKFFVPVNDQITLCPDEALLQLQVELLIFDGFEGQGVDAFTWDEACVTYVHQGDRGTERLKLQACDSLDRCLDFVLEFVSGPVLAIPFVDDFSYQGPYPDNNLWLDADVFVNYTLAENPPTLGVATFDGLDRTGTPYGGEEGFSDALTSTFIDLSGIESGVFLSFFVQPKGVGIKPRTIDSLVIDFRADGGDWVRVWQEEGLPNSVATHHPAPAFEYYRVPIEEAFRHRHFQFRFRNRSKNLGYQEFWHIDYVRLGDEEFTRRVFRDIAFVAPPLPVLSPYSSMPHYQFTPSDLRREIVSKLTNLDQVNLTMNDPTFTVWAEGQTLLRRTFIEPVDNWLLKPGRVGFTFDMNHGGSSNYELLQDALMSLVESEEEIDVSSRLEFVRADEFPGAQRNNTTTALTRFSDYYAYDDGTAESAIRDRGTAGVPSTKLAVEFRANKPDRLQGVRLHIPHIEGSSTAQLFNLMVWIGTLDGEPDFIQRGVRVFYADNYHDTLQGFTTYDLRDADGQKIDLDIPEGPFFIGWEQVDISGNKIPIGYDLNSPEGFDFFFFNVGQGWQRAATGGLRRGSLMLRAVMGNEPIIATSISEPVTWRDLVVFPNPGKGVFYFSHGQLAGVALEVRVYTLNGSLVRREQITDQIDLGLLPNGTYFIEVRHAHAGLSTTKLIIKQ